MRQASMPNLTRERGRRTWTPASLTRRRKRSGNDVKAVPAGHYLSGGSRSRRDRPVVRPGRAHGPGVRHAIGRDGHRGVRGPASRQRAVAFSIGRAGRHQSQRRSGLVDAPRCRGQPRGRNARRQCVHVRDWRPAVRRAAVGDADVEWPRSSVDDLLPARPTRCRTSLCRVQAASDEPFGGIPTLAYARLFECARVRDVIVLARWPGHGRAVGRLQLLRRRRIRSSRRPSFQGSFQSAVRADCLVPEFRER